MSKLLQAKRKYKYEPNYATPPGNTLKEVLESTHMTQKEFAKRTNLTEQTIIRILKGEQPITIDTANKFEMVTGVPSNIWNSLEMNYREQLCKINQQKELEKSISWLKQFPVKELIARKAINEEKNEAKLVQEVLKFYGVSSVEAWHNIWNNPAVAARRSNCFESLQGPASAWIRLGEIEAHKIDCPPYNKVKFKQSLKTIRTLTTETPEDFLPKLYTLCKDSGIALVLVPKIKKVPWNGAMKWLSTNKAMILLNLRGKTEDIFWFSFFHEAYHVLYSNKNFLYIEESNDSDVEEQKADNFASEFLIPSKYNHQISSITTKNEIIELAKKLNLSPGIVAGRYRYLTKRWSYFKDLTNTYCWKE